MDWGVITGKIYLYVSYTLALNVCQMKCSLKGFESFTGVRFEHGFFKSALRYCIQCDVNVLCGESKPLPPLTIAIREGLESIVSILLDHPRIDPTCAHVDRESTPFYSMIHHHCDPALVEKLINHPKFDINAVSFDVYFIQNFISIFQFQFDFHT